MPSPAVHGRGRAVRELLLAARKAVELVEEADGIARAIARREPGGARAAPERRVDPVLTYRLYEEMRKLSCRLERGDWVRADGTPVTDEDWEAAFRKVMEAPASA